MTTDDIHKPRASVITTQQAQETSSLAADPPSPDDVASGDARTARRGSSKYCHSLIFFANNIHDAV